MYTNEGPGRSGTGFVLLLALAVGCGSAGLALAAEEPPDESALDRSGLWWSEPTETAFASEEAVSAAEVIAIRGDDHGQLSTVIDSFYVCDDATLAAWQLRAGIGNNPGVLPPNAIPFGASYPEWHVAFWNWVMSMPAATNPMLHADDPEDQENAPRPLWIGAYDAAAGQSGHVWFLAEAYAVVEREATIPAGTPLCFPLQNHMVWGWPPVAAAEEWMRFYLDAVLDTAVISCEVDGVPIENLERYRHQSPAVPMILPEDNYPGYPPGEYGMMVDDGYYLILAPLSIGSHTIHWTATMEIIPYWNPWDPAPEPPYPQGFQEVTYYITVVP